MSSNDDLDARLAKARADMEELERAREERHAAAARLAKVEAAERDVEDAAAIARAEDELGVGKFATVRTPRGVVIVKGPNHMHFRKFVGAKEIGPDEAERLVLSCLVHPTRAAFEVIAEEYPAIPLLLAGAIADLAAGKHTELSGKS